MTDESSPVPGKPLANSSRQRSNVRRNARYYFVTSRAPSISRGSRDERVSRCAYETSIATRRPTMRPRRGLFALSLRTTPRIYFCIFYDRQPVSNRAISNHGKLQRAALRPYYTRLAMIGAGQTLGRKSRHDLFSREFLDPLARPQHLFPRFCKTATEKLFASARLATDKIRGVTVLLSSLRNSRLFVTSGVSGIRASRCTCDYIFRAINTFHAHRSLGRSLKHHSKTSCNSFR